MLSCFFSLGSLAAALVLAVPLLLPAQSSSADRPTSSTDQTELRNALAQTQQALREQAEAVRELRLALDEQARQIAELRRAQAPSNAATDSGNRAAQLRSAATELRATSATAPANASAKAAAPLAFNEQGPLFFRLGSAKFTPGGWVDLAAYYRSTNLGSGLGTNFQSIPYNNTAQGALSEMRLTAQSSRISMKVDEAVGKVYAYGYLEADFNGYQPGNAYVSTNSNTLRMRVYYLNLARDKWELLGGQGWSLLTPTRKALSPFLADLFTTFHLDTSYQAGLIFARQAQLRLVYHFSPQIALGLSAENPEQFSGSAVTYPTLFSTSQTDANSSAGTSGGATATPNMYPDFIAKATFDNRIHRLYWHAGAAGLLTGIRIDTPSSVTKTHSMRDARTGGAIIGNINFELLKGLRLISLGYWSNGGGRYIGGMGPSFVVLQNGTKTQPFHAALIHSGSAIGGFEWDSSRRTTLAAYYSGVYFQRRYGIDPSVSSPVTYIGYGYPGSANTHNRVITEATLASLTNLWQDPKRGALQLITQSSYASRSPWFVASGAPRSAHTYMQFMDLRYVFP